MIRILAALFIALAMSFSPLAMRAGAAMAAPSVGHHMETGHCGDQPGKAHDGKAGEKDCCVAMCVAIAAAPAAAVTPTNYSTAARRLSSDSVQAGYLARLPTPPPRRA